ncbi:hypothetical protein Tco_0137977 [Tanacetum coccineum]
MIWRDTSLRYGTGEKKVNKVDFISQGVEFECTCNNDKSLSEIQLEHEKEDEFVVVMVKVVHEWSDDGVEKENVNRLLKEVEKLEWWFEQDIDDEGEEDEEGKGGSEV